jgi:periplasmic copper chaperone A
MSAHAIRRSSLLSARRLTQAAALSAVALLALAVPASAHVTVGSDNYTRAAEDAILTFRVPNESDKATVTKVDITFPAKDPIASVMATPVPGWTITTKTVTFNPPIKTDDGDIAEGVGEIIWTSAAGQGIPTGDFGAFPVLVGPLPDADQVVFKAVQSYSDGTSTSWIEPVTDPENLPENPTPILELTAAADAASTPAPSASASSGTAAASSVDLSSYAKKSDVSSGRTLGLLGIVLGAIGTVIGIAGVARARRATAG